MFKKILLFVLLLFSISKSYALEFQSLDDYGGRNPATNGDCNYSLLDPNQFGSVGGSYNRYTALDCPQTTVSSFDYDFSDARFYTQGYPCGYGIWSSCKNIKIHQLPFYKIGTFTTTFGYFYAIGTTYKKDTIEIPTNGFLQTLWRGRHQPFSRVIPQPFGFALFDVDNNGLVTFNQYAGGLKYDGYYFYYEGKNIYLFDFKRKIVYAYNDYGDTRTILGGINFGGNVFKILKTQTPTFTAQFDYTFSNGSISQPANTIDILGGAYSTPLNGSSPSNNEYEHIYVDTNFQFLQNNTPSFYETNVAPGTGPTTDQQNANMTACYSFANDVKNQLLSYSSCQVDTHLNTYLTWTGPDERMDISNNLDFDDPRSYTGTLTNKYCKNLLDTVKYSAQKYLLSGSFDEKFKFDLLYLNNLSAPTYFSPQKYCADTIYIDPTVVSNSDQYSQKSTSWITSITDALSSLVDIGGTGSFLGSISGLTSGTGAVLTPVDNIFTKIKSSYQIPDIFPKYNSCSQTSSGLGKILLYGLFLLLSLSLFFKFK